MGNYAMTDYFGCMGTTRWANDGILYANSQVTFGAVTDGTSHTLAFGGRLSSAHEEFRRGVQLALQGGFAEVAAQLSIEDAEAHPVRHSHARVPHVAAHALPVRVGAERELSAVRHGVEGVEGDDAEHVAELRRIA